MGYTLGLDIGTNSIGWCGIARSPDGSPSSIVGIGVRIFADGRDPKSKTSLAVERREKRAMRRRRDRYLRRRQALLVLLVEYGLLPKDRHERKALESLNPYIVRAAALDGPIPLHHFGRSIVHLNQRRGFKSNRKTDKGDPESGKIAQATSKLRLAMQECGSRTFGEFLAHRLARGLPLRIRMQPGEGPLRKDGAATEGYAFYPDRDLLDDEFRAIWAVQSLHHGVQLTPERFEALHACMFFQRPLKQPEIGRCMLIGSERRLAKSDPLFQQRRLLEELNALVIERGPGVPTGRLTVEQRDKILTLMHGKKAVAFSSMRRSLGLSDAVFNKERAGRDKLLGDEVFAELSNKERYGPEWADVPLERQRAIIARLRDEQNSEKLVAWLRAGCGLDEGRARRVAGVFLPEGYGRLGETATRAIIRELFAPGSDGCVLVYSEAVERAAELPRHSDFRTGEIMDRLPYYGEVLERHLIPGTGDPADDVEKRLGKLTNPTVHIGLNQLRRVINAILDRYGHPDEVIVELARDLKASDDQKRDIQARQVRDLKDALGRGLKLQELGQPDTGANRALLKLWEELNPADPLDRRCIYTGDVISPTMLFSGRIDVDHILPWSQTLDDSYANRIVCVTDANRQKRNRTPFEAWGASPAWVEILDRASRLPLSKQWRFGAEAMNRFGEEADFLARHLVDTQYLSRLAREYMEAIAPGRVWVSTGKLTAMLRRHWGLNSLLPDHNFANTAHEKNRADHRHHAIDAAVTGVLNLGLIQRVAREAGRREADGLHDVIDSIAPPWPGFREQLGEALRRTIVSHRPDHGTIAPSGPRSSQQTAGGLHNDTAYGLTTETDPSGARLVVHRLPVDALKLAHFEETGARVRDPQLRQLLHKATQGLSGKAFEAAVREALAGHKDFLGTRRIRVIEPLSVIEIRDREGRTYKAYKGDSNFRYDIWRLPEGKWVADVITTFEAHRPASTSSPRRPHPAARRLLSLQQDDLIRYDHPTRGEIVARVVKFGKNGIVTLAEHFEAGALKARDADAQDPFRYHSPSAEGLRRARARRVTVDEIGRVRDPGFRE